MRCCPCSASACLGMRSPSSTARSGGARRSSGSSRPCPRRRGRPASSWTGRPGRRSSRPWPSLCRHPPAAAARHRKTSVSVPSIFPPRCCVSSAWSRSATPGSSASTRSCAAASCRRGRGRTARAPRPRRPRRKMRLPSACRQARLTTRRTSGGVAPGKPHSASAGGASRQRSALKAPPSASPPPPRSPTSVQSQTAPRDSAAFSWRACCWRGRRRRRPRGSASAPCKSLPTPCRSSESTTAMRPPARANSAVSGCRLRSRWPYHSCRHASWPSPRYLR
mmetsp:Transcript_103190/g.300941  ORF Transcript_103190/g.300941 Transcript_103190/m.300941 type:complete len:279 (+) Transcript_103190:1393-2229(+)